MRSLPEADPGVPDIRSPLRFLWWNARRQSRALLAGIGYATLWWLVQALMPAVLGKGIEAVTAKDTRALVTWASILFGLGLLQAFGGVMRHRLAVYNWLAAAYRTVQLTARQAARLGATLPKRLSTGEVVSVGNSDIAHIGNSMDILLRGTGSVVAIITVTVILISTSLPLGLLVLFGVPLMAVAVGPLLKPLHRRQARQRELSGELSTRAADIVAGLRVLRGIGGEQVFAGRYREESQQVRQAGVRVVRVESVLEGAQIVLPGVLIAIVTGIGASFAVAGEIPTGQLVAFYLYAVFLIGPMRTLTEMADKLTKGHVAAGRVIRILAMEPEVKGGRGSSEGGVLRDSYSGVTVQPGMLTAVAANAPEDAIAIADRLGRYTNGDVTFGAADLSSLPLDEVRHRILVADNAARLFTGRLRDELTVRTSLLPSHTDHAPSPDADGDCRPGGRDTAPGRMRALVQAGLPGRRGGQPGGGGFEGGIGLIDGADDERMREALYTACAEDIIEALPDGLDTWVAEAGREFSGGQQQRLRLVRALLADPEVLILVEPTSAVDAHSEARIAERLTRSRIGKTTLICTTSPLVLDRTDHVIYVEGGRVLAEGTHRQLLDSSPEYAATVTRGED
ncbi:ABC-type bacteriocin/lantibiotic exporter with double-glycine peptidase domain [Nonomuraea polychroma]|uniref:ABC-type bacteriocin/lantibiotic exporter with double-glycine peptidase domain n=1 Tax=Nonomuraea polychroma TaxID=46176 RepID=A0A438MFQ6_9ACTN|nr:ABC transporter ATP-binding protein [Nonomuraea polychroma]RVX44642.1 ABC-type bacteriocin/lantibiotic exporter with double-glycine peptidase domain [Nonomuraea polychroma]